MIADTFSVVDFNSKVFEMALNQLGWSQRKNRQTS